VQDRDRAGGTREPANSRSQTANVRWSGHAGPDLRKVCIELAAQLARFDNPNGNNGLLKPSRYKRAAIGPQEGYRKTPAEASRDGARTTDGWARRRGRLSQYPEDSHSGPVQLVQMLLTPLADTIRGCAGPKRA